MADINGFYSTFGGGEAGPRKGPAKTKKSAIGNFYATFEQSAQKEDDIETLMNEVFSEEPKLGMGDLKMIESKMPAPKVLPSLPKNVNPEWANKYPTLNKVLDTVTTPLQAMFSNPFVERAGQTGVEIITTVDNPGKISTGSRAGDITADVLGGVMGFAANPAGGIENIGAKAFNLGSKATEKALTKLPAIPKNIIGAGAGGVTYEAARAVANDREFDPAEMGTAALTNMLLAAATHGIVKAVPWAQGKVNELMPDSIPKIGELNLSRPAKWDAPATPYRGSRSGAMEPVTSIPKPKVAPGDIRTGLQKEIGLTPDPSPRQPLSTMRAPNVNKAAMDELQQGIETAQNYIGHNDILAAYPPGTTVEAAMADIKVNTGVDLPALMARAEQTQKAPGLREMALADVEATRLGQVAGAIPVPSKLARGNTPRYIGARTEVIPVTPQSVRQSRSGGIILDSIPARKKDNSGKVVEESITETGQQIVQGPDNQRGPLPQGMGAMSLQLPDTTGTIISKTDRQPISLSRLLNKAYIKSVNNIQRIKNVDDYTAKTTGRRLSPEDSAYMLASNSRGADQITRTILEESLVDAKGNKVGESLGSITKQIPAKQLQNFEAYMKARHAPSWIKEGKDVYNKDLGVDEIMAEKIAKDYEARYPEFKNIADQWDKWYGDFGQKWLVDTGVMSQKQWDIWRKKYPHYIKLQREMAEVEKSKWSIGKRAKGSERRTISFLESAIEDIDNIVKNAKRNESLQALIRQMERDPDGMRAWGEITALPEKAGSKNHNTFQKGIDGVLDEVNASFEKARIDPKHGNIIVGRVDGSPVHVKIYDPMLLDALTHLNVKGQGIAVEVFRQGMRMFKNLTTGINPMFSLLRNVARDIPAAFIASKSTSNPARFAYDLVDSMVSIMGNKEIYQSYKAMGGGHSSSISANRNLLAESKARILPGYINPNKPLQATKRLAGKAVSALERLNNTIETAPRLAEYKRFAKDGDYAGKVRGLYEANDITVNFQRQSEVSRFADAFVPYFNAAIQGIDKFVRTYKDNPAQAAVKSLFAITLPSVLLYAKNHNDPNYQKLNERDKDMWFMIPKDDGTFVRIPKPREIGVVFGALPERILRQWKDKDPEAFSKFAETLIRNFIPPTRTIAAPITDIKANEDWAGRPIVPGYMKNLSPGLQSDERTSAPAKFLGEKLNVSPKGLDYLARSYLGVLGQLGIPATTPGASVKEVLRRQVITDPVYSNKLVQDFYDKKGRLDTAYADAKQRGDELTGDEEKLRKLYGVINDTISDTRKQMREIEKNKLFNAEAKKGQLRGMQIAINSMVELASKPIEDQMKIYGELKRKGRIKETKPTPPARVKAKQKNEEKRYKETSGILLR